jgi:Arm DNA-binding domain
MGGHEETENRLSAVTGAMSKGAGMYADGGGLYLQVSNSGSKSWVFRFRFQGRRRDMGLGALP